MAATSSIVDDHPLLGLSAATKSSTNASNFNLIVLDASGINAITENKATDGLNNNYTLGVASTGSDSVSMVYTA